MSLDTDNFDLIESYLKGSLSPEEEALVVEKIRNDASFAEQVDLARNVNDLVIAAGLSNVRNKMSKDLDAIDGGKTGWKWLGFSLLVLMIGTGAYYWWAPGKETKVQTYTKDTAAERSRDFPEEKEVSGNTEQVPAQKQQYVAGRNDEKVESEAGSDTSARTEHAMKENNTYTYTSDDALIKEKEVQQKEVEERKDAPDVEKAECKISFVPQVKPTCKGEGTGSITVSSSNVSAGTYPYTFSIDKSARANTSGSFSFLEEGKYIVTVKDKNGCSVSREVEVNAVDCARKAYTIYPANGETWKVPGLETNDGKITIYNKAGIIIFRYNFAQGEEVEWQGTDLHGAAVPTGVYGCVIEFANGKTENIEITVVR